MPIIRNAPSTKLIRRKLRRIPPEPENRLWYHLRNRRLQGLKFRRQYAIGKYVVDFYCPRLRLLVEVDGDSHFSTAAQAYDAARESYMLSQGFHLLRFTNADVMQNLDGVLEQIAAFNTSPPPSP